MKKKRLALASLLAASMFLPACSSGSGEEPVNNAGKEETVKTTKLTMWIRTWDNLPYFQEAVDIFNKANPDINVEIVSFNPDQYNPAMQAAVNGGELPDLFQPFDQMNMYQLKENNLIQPLPVDEAFTKQFDEGTWWEGVTSIDGKPYGFPDSSFKDPRIILYYNKKLMKDAGLDPEAPPKTWDELYAQAKTIQEHTEGKSFGLAQPMKADWFNNVLSQLLATSVSYDNTFVLNGERFFFNFKNGSLFDKDALVESNAFIKRFIDEELMLPDYLLMDPPTAAAQFGEGNAAFSMTGYWFLRTFLNDYPDLDFGVAALPAKSNPVVAGTWGGSPNPFYLSSKTENKEAVKKLLDHFTKEYYPLLVKNQQNLSPIASVNNDANLNISPQFKDYIKLVNDTVRLQPSPLVRNSAEAQVMTDIRSQPIKESLGKMIQQYMSSDGYDLAKALDQYGKMTQEQFEAALKKVEGSSEDNWKFANWNISEDYSMKKYEELK